MHMHVHMHVHMRMHVRMFMFMYVRCTHAAGLFTGISFPN